MHRATSSASLKILSKRLFSASKDKEKKAIRFHGLELSLCRGHPSIAKPLNRASQKQFFTPSRAGNLIIVIVKIGYLKLSSPSPAFLMHCLLRGSIALFISIKPAMHLAFAYGFRFLSNIYVQCISYALFSCLHIIIGYIKKMDENKINASVRERAAREAKEGDQMAHIELSSSSSSCPLFPPLHRPGSLR